MRPVRNIPSDFFNLEEAIGQEHPLVEAFLADEARENLKPLKVSASNSQTIWIRVSQANHPEFFGLDFIKRLRRYIPGIPLKQVGYLNIFYCPDS